MKRGWNFIDSLFWWNKRQKREERRGHFLTNKESTELGKLINGLFYCELNSDRLITTNRGPQFSCYVLYTLPEFINHYKGDGEIEFQMGISSFWEEDDNFLRCRYVASVFENEIMYYLMKEHGVSYEAAYNFIDDELIPSDRYYTINFLGTIYRNIRNKLEFNPLCELLCDKVEHLYNLAEVISNKEGHTFDELFI